MADATETLRAFARQCALDVIHLWDAPEVVHRYLETGDESLQSAAWNAARAAAWNAANAAVWSASRDVARNWQNARLEQMLWDGTRTFKL